MCDTLFKNKTCCVHRKKTDMFPNTQQTHRVDAGKGVCATMHHSEPGTYIPLVSFFPPGSLREINHFSSPRRGGKGEFIALASNE